ncbi:Histone deacetylase complex subunit [Cryomyces antarcticus]|nr:Histone deacetylase complex subunit [Cryomyces antarcticus]
MNSRAAYDEEEVIRRVIEESKGEKDAPSTDNGTRRGKRSRNDSEEIKQEIKRRRTGSQSPTPPSNPNTGSPTAESDDESHAATSHQASGSKKLRGAAAKNHRNREVRERDKEREVARAEAAGRRKERAGRRRAEDSEPPDDTPNPKASTKDTQHEPPTSQRSPENLPSATATTTSHKKQGRPPQKRGRLGRNQYTKDRDQAPASITGSPHRSHSRLNGSLDDPSCNGETNGKHANGSGADSGSSEHKNGKGKNKGKNGQAGGLERTTMNEMKKRVATILDFISRTQVEMAGEGTPPSADSSTKGAMRAIAIGLEPMLAGDSGGGDSDDREFKDLSSTEMMDVLTRKLVIWQKEFGKYGEKRIP